MADFALLKFPNLISRKIWVIEKLYYNFHTVTEIHSHTFWQKYRESNGFTTFWFLHNFNIHCVDICSNHSLYEMQLRLIVQLEKFFFEINLKVDELFFA